MPAQYKRGTAKSAKARSQSKSASANAQSYPGLVRKMNPVLAKSTTAPKATPKPTAQPKSVVDLVLDIFKPRFGVPGK